jgi:DNA (cytosine-5)-methyltransferase 1
MFFFTKAKRAQNVNDYESWNEGGVAPTLNAMDNNGEAYATVLIIDGTRVNDVRVYEDGIMPTVISRYGTGGGNVPMIFSHTQGLDAQPSEENSPTLRTGGNGMAVVYPIDDARELEKHQNGTGIGTEGAPAYTLDRQQAPAVVAFSPSDFANYSEGVGTLKAGMTNNNSPVLAFDAYNHTTSDTNQTLRTGSDLDKMGTVLDSSVVRRLTPVECERLQGFPDNWTDGQADSNRYKQMGNAVAVPVVQWIINRMVERIGE